MTVDQAIQELQAAGASLRCSKLKRTLESLGFEVRDGKKAGHKIVYHSGLTNFNGSAYTCGHGRNPEVKPNYVRSMLKIIRNHEDALRQLLKEEKT